MRRSQPRLLLIVAIVFVLCNIFYSLLFLRYENAMRDSGMQAVLLVSGSLSLEQASRRAEIADWMTRHTLVRRRNEVGDLQTFRILEIKPFPTKNTTFVILRSQRKSYVGLERLQCSNGSIISIETVPTR